MSEIWVPVLFFLNSSGDILAVPVQDAGPPPDPAAEYSIQLEESLEKAQEMCLGQVCRPPKKVKK